MGVLTPTNPPLRYAADFVCVFFSHSIFVVYERGGVDVILKLIALIFCFNAQKLLKSTKTD